MVSEVFPRTPWRSQQACVNLLYLGHGGPLANGAFAWFPQTVWYAPLFQLSLMF